MSRRTTFALGVLSCAIACSPIVAEPLSDAPVNAGCPDVHGCDLYDVDGSPTKPQCHDGRCDFGRPDFNFSVVVNVPDSSYFAPGRAFVLTNKDLNAQPGTVSAVTGCKPPLCVPLPDLVSAKGKYRVTEAAAQDVGMPLPDLTSVPVRVSFVPLLGTSQIEAAPAGIPADPWLTDSTHFVESAALPPDVLYSDSVPVGRYLRVASPEPPFDEVFPPVFGTVTAQPSGLNDDFILGATQTPLDDPSGDSRNATVSRAEGLDGWRVWLIDSTTGRRISSRRTLSGTKMVVRLDTVGQTQPTSPALREGVDVIVAPPEDWIAVPRLQSRILNGTGLEALDVPSLPGPASVTGLVASGEEPALTGVPSRVIFASTQLTRLDGTSDPLLKYSTSVSTDPTGHFRTVLPPGLYDVTIEPAEGTGFSKVKDTFDTSEKLGKTYHPPMRTTALGRVLLADGRPLAEAEILAIPSDKPVVGAAVKPRPARTRTDRAGSFTFELDQGQYVFMVEPQAGTGFPRVVQLRSIPTGIADLGEIQVAPPTRLAFQLRDPSKNGNPIVRAMVRIFAELPGRGPPAVEIGRSMTGADGSCEILLAQQPR
ncbi:MAG: hypothetical protein JWP87_2571 [Labilithrix sp.]|nr:hypothetical protein [Labilithrix sp.]